MQIPENIANRRFMVKAFLTVILLLLAGISVVSADLAPKPEIFGVDLIIIILLSVFFLSNLCIELFVAFIYSTLRKLKMKKVLLAVFVANSISYIPFFIAAVTIRNVPLLEVIVILFECCVIRLVAKVSWKDSFFLSLAANLTSYMIFRL